MDFLIGGGGRYMKVEKVETLVHGKREVVKIPNIQNGSGWVVMTKVSKTLVM